MNELKKMNRIGKGLLAQCQDNVRTEWDIVKHLAIVAMCLAGIGGPFVACLRPAGSVNVPRGKVTQGHARVVDMLRCEAREV